MTRVLPSSIRRRSLGGWMAALVMGGLASMQAPSVACAETLPRIAVIATGGTIAGQGETSATLSDYRIGGLAIDELLKAAPALRDVAQVSGRQIFNVGSEDIDDEKLLRLRREVQASLDDPNVDGVVVTHGTDTLEESAFFLDMTLRSAKPVVLVGAMRPATALSADGPMNLLQAVALAASPAARDRGVLVVFGDRISSGYYVAKTHTAALDTFKALEQGSLGVFAGLRPVFYYGPATPSARRHFDVSAVERLPKVAVVYLHQGVGPSALDDALQAGARGVVVAAFGDGTLPSQFHGHVAKTMARGVPVVLSTRLPSGFVPQRREGIPGGFLNPQKARLLLALTLALGRDIDGVSKAFEIPNSDVAVKQ